MTMMQPVVAEFHNVLTADECDTIVNFAKKNLYELTVIGKESENGTKFRIGNGTWIENPIIFQNNIDLNLKLKRITSKLTGMPIENQELVHVVHYGIGGEYKEHHDFFHANQPEYELHTNRGGQRVYSALFYLNDDFTGGETKFTKKDVCIKPKKGKLLLWSNVNFNGTLDYDSCHAGLPVMSGEKYIAIIWVRQKRFS